MKIGTLASEDIPEVSDLCERELVLDRDAAALPRTLLRRPHIALEPLVWSGPLSYFSRTLHATIGRAFWLYE